MEAGAVGSDPMTNAQMTLTAAWRYPVKSLQGEQVSEAIVDLDGLRHDRMFGIQDEATGRILTGRREPRLLMASASVVEGQAGITLPDGAHWGSRDPKIDTALSTWLEHAVTLVEAAGAPSAKAEFFADPTDDTSTAVEWTMPPGRFVDALPLLVLTTASLRAAAELYPAGDWSPRRFRPNLLVEVEGDTWLEDSWCGQTVRVGGVVIVPREPCVRCTMVTRTQPGLDRDLDIYKTLARHHGGTLGVWATVEVPGTVHPGDPVEIVR